MPGQTKRTFKAEDQLDQGKAAKRQKKGRPAIRRLCKGMCYREPQLQPEDHEWDDELAPSRRPSSRATEALQAAAAEGKAGQQRADKQTKQAQAPQRQARKPKEQNLSGQAAVQLYLQKSQLREPTPLQSRHGSTEV